MVGVLVYGRLTDSDCSSGIGGGPQSSTRTIAVEFPAQPPPETLSSREHALKCIAHTQHIPSMSLNRSPQQLNPDSESLQSSTNEEPPPKNKGATGRILDSLPRNPRP